MKCLIAQMFPGGVNSATNDALCHPKIAHIYSLILWHYFIITAKEYERVVGWEGSDAVSPSRDGAAWILRNSLEGLRTLQVSLLILKCNFLYKLV